MKKIICLLACLFAGSVNASIILSTSGLTGTFITENFESNSGDGSAAGSQFAGITFDAGLYVSNSYSGAFPNMNGSVLANFYPCCQDPASFSFGSDLSDLAFAFVSDPQTTTFSAYLNNNLVESASLATAYAGNYVVFSGFVFNEIRITGVGQSDAFIIDDMQFKAAQVPEPGILSLLGLALAGIGFSRKKYNV